MAAVRVAVMVAAMAAVVRAAAEETAAAETAAARLVAAARVADRAVAMAAAATAAAGYAGVRPDRQRERALQLPALHPKSPRRHQPPSYRQTEAEAASARCARSAIAACNDVESSAATGAQRRVALAETACPSVACPVWAAAVRRAIGNATNASQPECTEASQEQPACRRTDEAAAVGHTARVARRVAQHPCTRAPPPIARPPAWIRATPSGRAQGCHWR